jgi:hypothetical protein
MFFAQVDPVLLQQHSGLGKIRAPSRVRADVVNTLQRVVFAAPRSSAVAKPLFPCRSSTNTFST